MYVRKEKPTVEMVHPADTLKDLQRIAIESMRENPPISASLYVLTGIIDPVVTAYAFRDMLESGATRINRDYYFHMGNVMRNNSSFFIDGNDGNIEVTLASGRILGVSGESMMIVEAGFVNLNRNSAPQGPAQFAQPGVSSMLALDKKNYSAIIRTSLVEDQGYRVNDECTDPRLYPFIDYLKDAIIGTEAYFCPDIVVKVH